MASGDNNHALRLILATERTGAFRVQGNRRHDRVKRWMLWADAPQTAAVRGHDLEAVALLHRAEGTPEAIREAPSDAV